MNKIYKIVWSRTKHCYVVASEFAKGHTKSNSAKSNEPFKIGATLAALALLGSIGVHSSVLAATYYGPSSSATGQTAVAIGDRAVASGQQAIALGGSDAGNNVTQAIGRQSIAIGGNVRVGGYGTIGIGGDDLNEFKGSDDYNKLGGTQWATKQFTDYNVNQGYGNGDGAIFIGIRSIGSGHGAVTLGSLSQATANVATALGMGAKANKVASVALGAASDTNKDAAQVSNATIKGSTYNFAGTINNTPGAVVSVGNNTTQRQIINVAPGAVTATSTDAINGSQLFAVANNITKTTVAVGSESLTLSTADTTATNGLLAYTVDLSSTAKSAIADIPTIKSNLASTASIATAASSAAASAGTAAAGAASKADAASTAAGEAKTLAGSASTAAAGAVTKADAASTAAASASTAAAGAVSKADAASTAAASASTAAAGAVSKADAASTAAASASTAAAGAVSKADAASTAASASTAAAGAVSKADAASTVAVSASTAAAGAASKADAASTAAASASTAAAGAVSKADAASTAAASASTAAAGAANKADAASTAAASANTAASTAQSTANAAQTTANAAKAVADTAVQNLTVGTDSSHNATGVTLTKNNNRLDIVGLGSVTTAVSSTNTINVGLTSSAESSIGAVAGISTAVTRIDSTVTNISTAVLSIDGTVSTIQTDLSTVKNDWDTVKSNATNSVQELKVGAGTGTTPITLDNKTNTLDIVGANSNANIITKVDGRNIAIDLSDSFKAQIHNLENKSNGSSVTYVTNDGQKVVKIDNAFYPEGTTLDKDGKPVDAQGNKAQPTDVKPEEIKVTVGDDTARQIGNVASGLDGSAADSNTKAISATEAKTAVGGTDGTGGLLGKTGKDLNNVATIKDLQAVAQAGLDFAGDAGESVHRPLSTTVKLVGGEKVSDDLTEGNIGVVTNGTDTLEIKLNKDINLTENGSLKFGDKAAFDGNNGLTVKGADGKATVVNADGMTSKTADGKETSVKADGIATNGNITATDKEGNKTTVDGNGITIDPAGEDKDNVSLTKDGLDNGGNKLKNVAAGTENGDVVNFEQYKELSNKLADMGTNSPSKLVDNKGDEVVKIGDNYYPVGTTKTEDGKFVNANGDEVEPIDTTTTPISAATNTPNSGLGIQLKDSTAPIANDGEKGANALVGGTAGADGVKTGGLLQATGIDLAKIATVGDLQAVAQAGLNFTGDTVGADNNKVAVHRPLSDTLAITGGVAEAEKLTDNNIGVVADEATGLTVKLAKNIDLGEEGSLKFGNDVSLTPGEGLSFAKDGGTAVYGPTGTTLTDKEGNKTVTNAAGSTLTDKEGNTTATNAAGYTITDKEENKTVISAKDTTVSDKDGNKTTVDSKGITIDSAGDNKEAVSLTQDGLDNGGNKLKNVAAGTENGDVVNFEQYKELSDKLADMGTNSPSKLVDNKGNEVVKIGDNYYPVGTTKTEDGKFVNANGDEVEPIDTSKTPISAATNTPNSGLGIQLTDSTAAIANDGEKGANALVGGTAGADGVKTGGLLQATGNDLAKIATVGDLQAVAQAGLNFTGDTVGADDTKVTVHRPLSDTLAITGGVADAENLTNNNIGVVADETNGLTVKLAKNIDLGEEGSLKFGNDVSLTPGEGLSFAKDGGTAVYGPTGTTLTDKEGNKTVTNAAGSTLTDKEGNTTAMNAAGYTITDKEENKTVISAKDTTVSDKDGNKTTVDSKGITIDSAGDNKETVSLTQDGLDNGGNKLKNVAAGTENGDVVNFEQYKELSDKLADMGTNSPSKLVDNKGNEVVKIGDNYYPVGTTKTEDGKFVNANGDEVEPIDTTTTPISAATNTPNSGLGIQLKDSTAPIANDGEKGANALVGGTAGADGVKTGGLLQATGNDLAKIATVGDLQAVAQAGLNFTGDTVGADNNKVAVHRPLSDTLAITGGVAEVEKLTDNNIGVVADETNGLTVKLAKNIDLGADGSLKFGKDASLTPGGGLSFTKDGGTAVYGPTGTTLTDKEGNTTVTNAAGSTLTDKEENKTVISAKGTAVSDKEGNTNTSTATENKLADDKGNSNTSNATSNTITDGMNTNTSTATENKLVDDKGNSNTANATGVTVEKTVDGKTISNSLTADALTTKGADGQETVVNADGMTSKTADGKESSVKADGITTNGNITATDKDGNKTTVDGNGITIDPAGEDKDNVSLTKDGLDNGGNRLKNIGAAEKSGDAVTFDQFKALEKKFSAAAGMTTVDEDGDKVVTVGDKQYKVDENGNPLSADKKTKLIEVDGKYYNPSDVNEDGTLKDNAEPADSTVKGNTSLSSDAPTSGLGLTKAVKGDDAKGIQATGPIDATTAKNVVGGSDGKSGLLGKSGADLNKIVTVQDLQAVAQAGLNFTGDTVDAEGNKVNVHRPLSNILSVTGGVADEKSLTDNNIGVVANQDNGLTVKLNKDITLPNGSVTTTVVDADGKETGRNVVSGTGTTTTATGKDGNTLTNTSTAEGNTISDGKGNSNTSNATSNTITDGKNTNTSTATENKLADDQGNSNTSNATSNTITDGTNTNTSTATENKLTDDKGNSNTSNATSNTITDGKNTNTSTATENKLVDDKGNSNTANANGVTVEKTVDGKKISNSLTADALTTKGADGQETVVNADGMTSKTADGKESSVKADGITTNGNITATDTAGNKTTVDGNGITIDPKEDGKGNVSLTKDGLDNGGNRLKNIGAAEKSGDAVTFDQFKALERKFSAAGGMETVDEDGDKVVTIDSNVYKVDKDGNPVDEEGNKLKEVDGKYYNTSDVNEDGTLKDNVKPADSTATGDTSLSSNAGASGLGLTKAKDADEADGIEATGPISAEDAKKAIAGEDGKDGLLDASGKALNKLVTVQDLQAVAQAGLDFAGDDANDVHRPLSSKLTITGGVTEKDDLTDKNIGVVRNETGDGLEVKLAKNIDLGDDGSIKLGDKVALDGKDGLTVKGDDGNSAVYGGNGLTLTDKEGNSNALTPKDSTLADNKGNKNTSTATSNALADDKGNSNVSTSTSNTLADDKGNSNTSTATSNTLADDKGNSNTSDATSNTISDGKGNSTSNSADGTTVKDDKGNETSVKADGVVTKDKDGNSSSMKPEGVEITDKDGNKTTVDANGISLKDKDGNALVTIDKDGLGGKDGAPVDFKNGINVPGALTVTPATKDANGNIIDPVIDAHGNRIQNVGNGILPTDAANIGQLESVRSDMKNHLNNVGSMTAALAALNPLPYIGGEKGQIMAGVGVYENKQAVALGYAYTPNSDQQYTLGLSYGEGGKTMANVGATFRIGSGDGATTLAEHVKAQTSKEYEAKLAEVKAASDAKISDLQSQVEELRQLVATMAKG